MPAFRYTVINQQNQQLSGILNAANADDARKELNNLGFAVVTLEDISTISVPTPVDQPVATQTPGVNLSLKFAFIAIDKTNRRIRGTIAAQDVTQAYRRLVEEYRFLVEALTPATAQMSETEATQFLRKIKDDYERERILTDNDEHALLTTEEQGEKEALLENVDFILKKINEVLTTFGDEIKPEMKKAIREDVDRLLRIKSSNNISSIKQTCKELLQRIQDRETFLHSEVRVKEKTQLQLETETLMHSLGKKSSQDKQEKEEKIAEKKPENRFTKTLAKLFPPDSNDVIECKERIAAVNDQLKTYIKLWLSADKNYKEQIKISMHTLWEERTRLKNDIKGIRTKEKQQHKIQTTAQAQPDRMEKISKEIYTITLWLLYGYLSYYFVIMLTTTKKIPLTFPSFLQMNVYHTRTFFPVLVILFIVHTGLALQQVFYPQKLLGKILTLPLTLFCAFFVLINFF